VGGQTLDHLDGTEQADLSPSTAGVERREKAVAYAEATSLRLLVLVDPDTRRLELAWPINGAIDTWDVRGPGDVVATEFGDIDVDAVYDIVDRTATRPEPPSRSARGMSVTDAWASGAAYEPYVGRWSRVVAGEFLDWLHIGPGKRWLDVGCGTGALTAAVLAHCDPMEVVGVDPSDAYIAWATAHVDDDRARFVVADAAHLPAVAVDVAVSGLALNFFPDPGAALAAIGERAMGGTVAAYVWDYAGRMDLMRHFWDAAVALDPAAAALDEGARFPICHPDRLAALWREGGLVDVATRAIDVPTVFGDFDDYWTPFLGGNGPAPAYAMSLDQAHRAALRHRIRARLPIAADGSISLIARAWAVRGRAVP
jgi:SAM-dependent methyltransferase